MKKIMKLKALPQIYPEMRQEEKDAVEWAAGVLGDVRIRQLYVNLKNYDYDIMGTFNIDENGAGEILGLLRDILEVE